MYLTFRNCKVNIAFEWVSGLFLKIWFVRDDNKTVDRTKHTKTASINAKYRNPINNFLSIHIDSNKNFQKLVKSNHMNLKQKKYECAGKINNWENKNTKTSSTNQLSHKFSICANIYWQVKYHRTRDFAKYRHFYREQNICTCDIAPQVTRWDSWRPLIFGWKCCLSGKFSHFPLSNWKHMKGLKLRNSLIKEVWCKNEARESWCELN